EPAEVRVPLLALDEERHVRAVPERDLRSGDRPDAERLRGVRELERAEDAAVGGERTRLVSDLRPPHRQPPGPRRPASGPLRSAVMADGVVLGPGEGERLNDRIVVKLETEQISVNEVD